MHEVSLYSVLTSSSSCQTLALYTALCSPWNINKFTVSVGTQKTDTLHLPTLTEVNHPWLIQVIQLFAFTCATMVQVCMTTTATWRMSVYDTCACSWLLVFILWHWIYWLQKKPWDVWQTVFEVMSASALRSACPMFYFQAWQACGPFLTGTICCYVGHITGPQWIHVCTCI